MDFPAIADTQVLPVVVRQGVVSQSNARNYELSWTSFRTVRRVIVINLACGDFLFCFGDQFIKGFF